MSDSVPTSATESSSEGSVLERRSPPLRYRAGFAFGLLSLLLSAILSIASYALVRSSLLGEHEMIAKRQAFLNARLMRPRLDPLPADMGQVLANLQLGPSGDSLLRVNNRWFTSSVDVSQTQLPSSVTDAVSEGQAATQRYDNDGEPVLVVGVPINAVSADYFEISSLNEVESTLSSFGRSLAIAALVVTALGAFLGAGLTTLILLPLRRFADVAARISNGESSSRLDPEGDADLEPLADSFNEMLDELQERIDRERRFASDVSHEIRGPVATLSSALSIVERRRAQLPDEVVPAIDALGDQVSAFNRLVLDLLEISRFDARTAEVRFEDVDLDALCREIVEERGYESVTVTTSAPTPVVVPGDSRRLAQVISNLLQNAAHYAGGATDLIIDVDKDAGRASVSVEDRGPGVPDEEKMSIFGRFHRGSTSEALDAPRGTGLGLALSSQHLALHGGDLWVEDREGGGARFRFQIPLDRSPDSAQEKANE